jgi:ubiquinone/menaquinone biosynthesis C-methylase UbiE
MWSDHIEILRCPISGQPLRQTGQQSVGSVDGRYSYPVLNDVICLLPQNATDREADKTFVPAAPSETQALKDAVKKFYDEVGWTKSDGGDYRDTIEFADRRPLSYQFTENCMRRVGKYLPRPGRYLLDAGSGAIPHKAYLEYDKGFQSRICVDFSMTALLEAREKLGDRGVYVLGDITNLPLADNSVDAVTCNHVVYHIPAEEQPKAFKEISRVLKSGGRAAVVYAWSYSPLSRRLEALAARLVNASRPSNQTQGAELPWFPQSVEWFTSQRWPFAYGIRVFRVVDNEFLRRHVGDDLRSRLMLFFIECLQKSLPRFAGRYGKYPVILISK